MGDMEERVKSYWTRRAHDFGTVRRMELEDGISRRWLFEIEKHVPDRNDLTILDVGTGAGYFAVLLANQGYQVSGVDLTPAMIKEAEEIAKGCCGQVTFQVMDAQNLDYSDESFDVVIARNLTWTLPRPDLAYKEWMRVLKKGGILLNFDADYGQEVRNKEEKSIDKKADVSEFHIGLTEELRQESDQITLSMDISQERRPEWDLMQLKEMGFVNCTCDREAGARILKERNAVDAPVFLLTVEK
ncbi:class I SAM-dependent methyltransferase [Clostridium sp. E02]|uniref:class I SAM-dependent methyltransferase n=1 Tax=Clostridium sp. E02 TaxID=2487134 RepID=UPI0013DDA02F|nr:class I SAM-dependent methyltransferase [Clostridium sp. E02]